MAVYLVSLEEICFMDTMWQIKQIKRRKNSADSAKTRVRRSRNMDGKESENFWLQNIMVLKYNMQIYSLSSKTYVSPTYKRAIYGQARWSAIQSTRSTLSKTHEREKKGPSAKPWSKHRSCYPSATEPSDIEHLPPRAPTSTTKLLSGRATSTDAQPESIFEISVQN